MDTEKEREIAKTSAVMDQGWAMLEKHLPILDLIANGAFNDSIPEAIRPYIQIAINVTVAELKFRRGSRAPL